MTTVTLLTVEEARRALGGVSAGTVYNLIRDGSLPLVKVRGRSFLRADDIAALIERSVQKGRAEE